jgi:hypothetical protein
MYNHIANIYYSILVLRNSFFSKIAKKLDFKDIPIIINNRNRLTFLKMLIESLQRRGYHNIYILDNASTYLPLLEYYKTTSCKVVLLGKNMGFDALEQIPLFDKIKKNYFVYTDSDVVPVEECPVDFLDFFLNTLKKYPEIQKVGFSLKIDDLPDSFSQKQDVINWESQFFQQKISDGLFLAPIDTTFALHRPYARLSTKGRFKNIRTEAPYTAYHMPWYNDSKNLSEEEKFYIDHVEIGTHWSKGFGVENQSFIKRLFKKKKYKK